MGRNVSSRKSLGEVLIFVPVNVALRKNKVFADTIN